MDKEYDKIITQHYKKVADQYGTSPSSTMPDMITRTKETEAVLDFVKACLLEREAAGHAAPAVIMDVGCGNGYTLEQVAAGYPGNVFVGVEKSEDLRALARERFAGRDDVTIVEGDIRNRSFAEEVKADILLCQRVIINLLSLEDQRQALENIVACVKPGMGGLLFIECFEGALANLNEAREEFNLPAIGPAYHNRYLPDDFFEIPALEPYASQFFEVPANFLSTHYYVARVLHEIYTPSDSEFKRNSEFVQFFTGALRPYVGDYAPLKLHAFKRSE